MKEELRKSLHELRKGGVILYPTDTIWGLGCDATNEETVKKIFSIKHRPGTKSMIILVAEPMQVKFYADAPEVALELMEYAEQPLTLILPKAKGVAKSLIADDGTIGIRVVKDEFCRQIIHAMHKPLVSTSANISGEPAPANFSEISEEIKDKVDYVVNLRQHETHKSAPSRIMKIDMDGRIEVIR